MTTKTPPALGAAVRESLAGMGAFARPPAGIAAMLHRHLSDSEPPVEPRDSATVLLLRDGPSGLETFLVQRAPTMVSGAGKYVFPGGLVDAQDRVDGSDELLRAAVRETFEESGVLLARPHVDRPTDQPASAPRWAADRAAVAARTLTFDAFLERRGMTIDAALLRPLTRWITPVWAAYRYDVRFFIARCPEDQEASIAGREADHGLWLPVADAIRGYETNSLPIMLPTACVLRILSAVPDLAGAFAAEWDLRPYHYDAIPQPDGAYVACSGPDGEVFRYLVPPDGVGAA